MAEQTTVNKPWGYYVDLDQGDGWKAKRLELLPNRRFSLQMHGYRDERWTVVSGYAKVTINGVKRTLEKGQSISVRARDWHRAQAGEDGCTIIEVQMGVCNEDDIVRKEDDYGRVES